MAISPKDKLPKKPYLPDTREQNPAPVSLQGQQGVRARKDISNQILSAFAEVLPSNYVSEVPGPYYVLQFQAAAEELARIQLLAEDISLSTDVDFARPEFLFQMIGTLVFPESALSKYPQGIPEVDGDLTYRTFLKRMFQLLLQGTTEKTQEGGLSLLTEAQVDVLAKVDFSDDPNSGWDISDQHSFEINLLGKGTFTDPDTGEEFEGDYGTGFPKDPITLHRNNQRILRALKPAKAIYEYRHLFKDAFGQLFQDRFFSDLTTWYYEDFRKFCQGFKEITGDQGETRSNRVYFADKARDFSSVVPGATLEILSGPNASPENGGEDDFRKGQYRVVAVLYVPSGTDTASRPYVTSPSGLTGNAVVNGMGDVYDPDQDFSNIALDESITFLEGPNAGGYRINTLLGPAGGPNDGSVPPGSGVTSLRLAMSVLEVQGQMPVQVEGQAYQIALERLGTQLPRYVFGEDASSQFFI